ncbi:MAG: hypothetical protein BroJett013_12260 [Alphaproteobacteria bacterium]|nr:MAG: hypothetical protein BroJett013_12260 [Alphaproteobacteria bacterium]
MGMRIVLAALLMFFVFDGRLSGAWAQGANALSPWAYPADIRAPTDEEYRGLRERFSRAMAYRTEQNWRAAIPLLRENLTVEARTYGPEHPVTGMAMFALAGTLEPEGEYEEAEGLLVDAIRIARTWLPVSDPWYSTAYNILGMCQGANAKWADAEASFLRAIEVAQSAGDARGERLARANLADMTRFRQQQRE